MTTHRPTQGFEPKTPAPYATMEDVVRISEDKAELKVGAHRDNCRGLEALARKVDKMENTQVDQGKLLSEFVGAQKLSRWLVPIVVGVCSSSAAVALVQWLARGAK